MNIDPAEFIYDLPEDRIAKHPLSDRDSSKLLYYQDGVIQHQIFRDIPELIPEGSTLFFNETRVIPARLQFQRETGARIEVFLLEPVFPSRIMQSAIQSSSPVLWKCMIGNLKKWKDGEKLSLEFGNGNILLQASLQDRENGIVELKWDPADLPFSELISEAGNMPLPPYIKRELEEEDKERYQTVYSRNEGAVAAPTAGLHFTPEILKTLSQNGARISNLTLHVSAGTFQPLKVSNALDHPMHSEQMIVRIENIQEVLNAERIISVGTTSMRTLESLYWYGVKLIHDPDASFRIEKLYPYEKYHKNIGLKDAFGAVLEKMQKEGITELIGETEIFLFPGYDFKVCDGLVTNYHLPGSTLILLVAAFIGDNWKNVYKEALDNDYRFLSYGDSSLLMR